MTMDNMHRVPIRINLAGINEDRKRRCGVCNELISVGQLFSQMFTYGDRILPMQRKEYFNDLKNFYAITNIKDMHLDCTFTIIGELKRDILPIIFPNRHFIRKIRKCMDKQYLTMRAREKVVKEL